MAKGTGKERGGVCTPNSTRNEKLKILTRGKV